MLQPMSNVVSTALARQPDVDWLRRDACLGVPEGTDNPVMNLGVWIPLSTANITALSGIHGFFTLKLKSTISLLTLQLDPCPDPVSRF